MAKYDESYTTPAGDDPDNSEGCFIRFFYFALFVAILTVIVIALIGFQVIK